MYPAWAGNGPTFIVTDRYTTFDALVATEEVTHVFENSVLTFWNVFTHIISFIENIYVHIGDNKAYAKHLKGETEERGIVTTDKFQSKRLRKLQKNKYIAQCLPMLRI